MTWTRASGMAASMALRTASVMEPWKSVGWDDMAVMLPSGMSNAGIRLGSLAALLLLGGACAKKERHQAEPAPAPEPVVPIAVIDAAVHAPERASHVACAAERPGGHASPDLPGMCR